MEEAETAGRRATLELLGRELSREAPVLARYPAVTSAHMHNVLSFRDPARGRNETLRSQAARAAGRHTWLRVTNVPNPGPSRLALRRRLSATDTSRIAWGPGSGMLAATQGSGAVILDVEHGTTVTALAEHGGNVTAVGWSPDGRWIATSADDGTVFIHDAASWDRVARIDVGVTCRCVSWDRGSQVVAVGCDDGAIRILNTELQLVTTLLGHEGPVWVCAWCPTADMLASGGEDDTVKMWSPGAQHPIASARQHEDAVTALAWHPSGTMLASGGMDYQIVMWSPDLSKGAGLPPAADGLLAFAFSPDGAWMASSGMSRSIRLDNTQGADPLTLWGHGERVSGLAWSPDSTVLVSCSNSADEPLSVWDVALAGLSDAGMGHENPMLAAQFSRTGDLLVTTDFGMSLSDALAADRLGWPSNGTGKLCVWNSHDNTLVDAVGAGYRMGFAVDWTCDDSVAFSDFGRVCLWRRETGEVVIRADEHDNFVTALACHPSEHVIANGSADGTVSLWDPSRSDTSFASVSSGSERVLAIAWSPDGAHLAVAGMDGAVRVFDADLGLVYETCGEPGNSVHSVEWTPDGSCLVWADTIDTLNLFAVASGATRSRTGVGQTVRVSVSSDGRFVATGGFDGRLAVWDATTLEPVALELPSTEIRALRFSSDNMLWCSDAGETAGSTPLIMGYRLELKPGISVGSSVAPRSEELVLPETCKNCGAIVEQDQPWCPVCGQDVETG